MNTKSVAMGTAILVAVWLSVCTVTPPRVSIAAPTVTLWAPVAPPPPGGEVIPPVPGYDYFRIAGHWHREGNEHGHWEPHRAHEHRVPHRWERDDHDQWRLTGGYWHRE